jgi:hypothetical protein
MLDARNRGWIRRHHEQAPGLPPNGRSQTVREVCLGILGCLLILGVPCLHAWAAAEWTQPNYSVTIAAPLTKTGDVQSGSAVLTLNHDGPVTIQVAAASSGSEVLNSSTHDTLTTSYKLTGPALSNPDSEWVPSATFVSPATSYSIPGIGPASQLTLWARAQTAAARANDSGNYTASLVLTASW